MLKKDPKKEILLALSQPVSQLIGSVDASDSYKPNRCFLFVSYVLNKETLPLYSRMNTISERI